VIVVLTACPQLAVALMVPVYDRWATPAAQRSILGLF